MAKKKKVVATPKKKGMQLTVCKDCAIQLIVRPEVADKCGLCKSVNITVTAWK